MKGRRQFECVGRGVLKCDGYLESNIDILWYTQHLAAGRPIGTGLIEGGCKTIVSNRLKLNNAPWTDKHAEQMAALRCLITAVVRVLDRTSSISANNISYTLIRLERQKIE